MRGQRAADDEGHGGIDDLGLALGYGHEALLGFPAAHGNELPVLEVFRAGRQRGQTHEFVHLRV